MLGSGDHRSTAHRNPLQSKQAASQVSMKYRVKRISTRTFHSSGDHRGTAHRNHYSPNRAATQVSMKYRVKRNQCQDLIHKPIQHSRSENEQGQTISNKRTGSNETQTSPQASLPPQQSGQPGSQHKVQVIPSDKRARTTPENQSAQQARYA